jgi:cyclophilin family peptidyl-prolyl cis-trans isomerase
VGDIDIILYASLTPETVTNFLAYVGRGDYGGVTIHRAEPGFVVQGGGYKATAAPDSFAHIPTEPSPMNEPGISNVRGTIAMAKRGGDPNSATSEFFFNLADNNDPDNPMSLDNQNGGFSVFGRVSAPGMEVVDAIAALPRETYVTDLEGMSWTNAWPMNAESAPPTMDQSKLVVINSVTPVPPLSHFVASNTNPAVVSGVVTNGQLELSALEPGQSEITVTATDLDGNAVSQTFDVRVTQSFEQWAGRSSFPGGLSAPGDDGDNDGLCNLHEFAFLTDPAQPDGPNGRPVFSLSNVAGAMTPKITFRLRKYTDALSYRVEASTNLVSWEEVWSSSDGLSVPDVHAEDRGDYYLVTVERTGLPPGAVRHFLRVVASSTSP